MSRADAERLLGHRLRVLVRSAIIGVVMSPVAIAVIAVPAYVVNQGSRSSVEQIAGSIAAWSAIIIPILLLTVTLLARRKLAFARRIRPIVRTGAERFGTVIATRDTSRDKAGVQIAKRIIDVQLDDGTTLQAFVEEPVGTKLPHVDLGARAVVWTSGQQSVVGVDRGLFETRPW